MATYYETHREDLLARCRERRDWYRSHGICIRCGQAEALPGKRSCGDCLYKVNEKWWSTYVPEENREYRRERYARLRAAGLCVWCAQPAAEGRCMCEDCRKKHNRNSLRWHERTRVAKDPALCRVRVCQQPRAEGYTYCAEHLEMVRAAVRRGAEKRNNAQHPWRRDEMVRKSAEKWRRNAK